MTQEYPKFNTTINDIEFKILRKDDNCWIKVVPITQHSAPSSLHIIVNDEDDHWDIYDKSGTPSLSVSIENQGLKNPFFKRFFKPTHH